MLCTHLLLGNLELDVTRSRHILVYQYIRLFLLIRIVTRVARLPQWEAPPIVLRSCSPLSTLLAREAHSGGALRRAHASQASGSP